MTSLKSTMASTVKLYDFQQNAVDKLTMNEEMYGIGSVLALEMGLGKSITYAFFTLQQKKKEKLDIPDLLIVPLAVLTQWKTEILRLDNTVKVFIYHGSDRNLEFKSLKYKPDYVIATYHCLVTRELEEYDWNRIALDEAHIIRNGIETSEKNIPKKAIGAFEIKKKARFCHCITGTPYNNNTNDIKSLMKFVNYKEEDVNTFVDNFVIQKTKDGIMEPINTQIIMIEKPPFEHIVEYGEILFKYNTTTSILRNEKNLIKRRELYKFAMHLLTKLRICCNLLSSQIDKMTYLEKDDDYDEDMWINEEFDDDDMFDFYTSSPKINTVINHIIDTIETVPYNRIIVFSSFVSTLKILESIVNRINPDIKTFQYIGKKNNKERNIIVNNFTDKDDTSEMVLFASLGAGSCGLNLTPCATILMVDISMNPFDQLQAVNRVHRITQTNKVNVFKFCMEGMIEERILLSHDRKFTEAKSSGLKILENLETIDKMS